MIIDCHGHFTTGPAEIDAWRDRQIAAVKDPGVTVGKLEVSDDQLREAIELNQLKLQQERGTDVTFFSPRASTMGHHQGNDKTSAEWTELQNDIIHRICNLFPDNFAPVCMLPQSPGVRPESCIPELERCINQLGFIGCNLNPDPAGGWWTDPPLTDRWWYPLYEKIVELDVPVMVHVTRSTNDNFHFTGAHYMNSDTTAFMQFLTSDLFKDFPTIRFIIPHGGGAVPYHWGRYRGLAQDMGKPPLTESLLNNVFFDTCVYHKAGMECLLKVIPNQNVLFASEMVGAVRGIDPETGKYYDDTKSILDGIDFLSQQDRQNMFEANILRVFPRYRARA